MMRGSLFALVAMVPLGVNPALLVTRDTIGVALCSGGAIALPLGPARLPGDDRDPCCGKACHAGGSRKRSSSGFDPAQ
jgi:hypothetical protein